MQITEMKRTTLLLLVASLLLVSKARAQQFFNLSAEQVKIDSVMPHFGHAFALPENYEDSIYTVSILYPEFIDMSARDLQAYRALTNEPLPQLPIVNQEVVFDRKKPAMQVTFTPFVERERPQILVAFMLKIEAKAKNKRERRQEAKIRQQTCERR